MKKLSIILCLLVFAFAVKAQQKYFKPGYVVNIEGDTVKGFIKYNFRGKNPNIVYFSKTADAWLVERYYKRNLTAFGITGIEEFERAVVEIDKRSLDPQYEISPAEQRLVTDTVLLSVMVKGDVMNLYFYKDAKRINYFIKPAGLPLEELMYIVSYYNNHYFEQRTYRTQFAEYTYGTGKLPAVRNLIDQTLYMPHHMIRVVKAINNRNEMAERWKSF